MTSAITTATDLRSLLRNVPTPISFIATHTDQPLGMIVGSFVSISAEPPLVGIFLQKSSSSWPAIEQALVTGQELGISILGGAHADHVRKLSGPSDQRFENLEWASTENGAIHLEGADAQLTTKLHDLQEIGDHFFAVLEVIDASADQDFSSALVYHRSQVSSL
ncbi:flavin reductase family protein [Corynebacterium glutamicum]|uniref:flavin reductase family protein n=1 Tax=Corynebacterium glutamicum TaxID=1718 RepID=UPI001C6EF03D|nr:flavin reductase family protein [Corynebacterium glutamicum]QYR18442.1 flavin reductase family protein [Corynebacterium glutamicum]